MKIYRIILAPVIPLIAIFIIYPITGSIIFSIIWSLAIIFGIYDLKRFFANQNIYFVTVAIVFGIFFGGDFSEKTPQFQQGFYFC